MYTPLDISRGWLKDFSPLEMPQGGLVECKNLIPEDEAYMPFPDKATYSSGAVSGTPLKGQMFKNPTDGARYSFIGTGTKLYRLEANKSVSDISKTATTYTGSRWSFEIYGTWIIATNFTEVPQVLKGLTAANFADLGGSPPKSKFLLFHKGHLIHLNLNEGGTLGPKKVLYSAFENVELYTPSLSTGAGFQTLADADGEIVGVANVGNNFGIFHENSITLGWYTGAPYTFNFETNRVKNIGAIPGSIISVGRLVYFWDRRDIYVWDGSSDPVPLGYGVRKTILEAVNFQYDNRIYPYYDAAKGIIYWLYPTTASVSGTPNRMIAYNPRTKQFTHIDIDAECIFSLASGTYTMDNMDTEYPSIDAIPVSLDSNFWQTGVEKFACINNTDSKVATFSGANLTSEIETGDLSKDNKILYCRNIRPKIERATSTITCKLGMRMNENDAISYSSTSDVNIYGEANVHESGRYLRANMQVANHSGIKHIDLDVEIGGDY